MVAGHFGAHKFFSADLAGCKFLADLGFFIVRKTRWHWSSWQENAGKISKSRGRNDKTGYDFVANTQINGRVKCVVGKRDPARHGDHIT